MITIKSSLFKVKKREQGYRKNLTHTNQGR